MTAWLQEKLWQAGQNRRRLANRAVDAVAWTAGHCMATTWRPDQATYKPGFKHWRCWKPRRHVGPHRTGNYRWHTGGMPIWDPLPVNLLVREQPGVAPKWLAGRHHPVGTRRRDRVTERVARHRIGAGWAGRPQDWGGWLAAPPGGQVTEAFFPWGGTRPVDDGVDKRGTVRGMGDPQ